MKLGIGRQDKLEMPGQLGVNDQEMNKETATEMQVETTTRETNLEIPLDQLSQIKTIMLIELENWFIEKSK